MPHARERRVGCLGYRLVIESHDGDIVRNSTAGTLENTESHRGHRVRGHKHAVEIRLALKQEVHRPGCAFLAEIPDLLEGGVDRKPSGLERIRSEEHTS